MPSLINAVRTTGVTAANVVTNSLTLVDSAVESGVKVVTSLQVQADNYAERVRQDAAYSRKMIPLESLNEAQKRMYEILCDQHAFLYPGQAMDHSAIAQQSIDFLTKE